MTASTARRIDAYLPHEFFAPEPRDIDGAERDLAAAIEEFKARLAAMSESVLNAPVAPGRWSPLQYADHRALTQTWHADGAEGVIRGEPAPTSPMGYLTEDGRALTLDFLEGRQGRELGEVLTRLEASARRLVAAARKLEAVGRLHETVVVTPFFGALNALGALQLAAFHISYHACVFPSRSQENSE